MTRPFLFGSPSGSQSQNKYLVEFRAGKMTTQGKMVTPDKRKGLVYINQTEDSLMHFCWKDRKTGTVEDDLIIFPDDAEFKKVPQCTTGRVFILKFKSSSRRSFYWMQEPKADKDDELCSKVNEYLNNPPPVRGGGGAGGPSSQGGTDLSSLGEGEIHNLINNMSQQQLVQLLAGQMGVNTGNLTSLLTAAGSRPTSSSASNLSERGATTTTTPATTTSASQPAVTQVSSAPVPRVPDPTPTPTTGATAPASIQLAELQNILSGLNVPAGASSSQPTPAVDLNNAVTMEALQPLIDNAPLMERLRALLPPSTDEGPVSEQLRSTVQSPQFQQAMSMFSQALQSGQLGPLMEQFDMSKEVVDAANSGDMDAFVKALQSSQKKQQQDKKDDEEMNLD